MVAWDRGCHWTHMLLGRTWYVDRPDTPRNTKERNREGGRSEGREKWREREKLREGEMGKRWRGRKEIKREG